MSSLPTRSKIPLDLVVVVVVAVVVVVVVVNVVILCWQMIARDPRV